MQDCPQRLNASIDKKPYTAPCLTVHGTAAGLTQGEGGNSPDGEGGGSFPFRLE